MNKTKATQAEKIEQAEKTLKNTRAKMRFISIMRGANSNVLINGNHKGGAKYEQRG